MSRPETRHEVIQIPTPLTLAERQYTEALEYSKIKTTDLPRFQGFDELTNVIGPMLPGDLWVVGARTGNGKTTLLLNLLDSLVTGGWPVLYLTTEIRAAQMRRMWAAMRLGFDAQHVLENAWERLPPLAQKQIDDDIHLQAMQLADSAAFFDIPYLTGDNVRRALKEYAINASFGIIVLDHINRWIPRDASQKTAEVTAAVQAFKAVAMEHGMGVLLAAQANRGQDRSPLAEFMPPPLSALKQTGALEEESSVVLMLHRQRRSDVTAAQIKEVASGQRDVKDLLEPDVMCVNVAKHRIRGGHATGRIVRMRVGRGGRLSDMASQVPLREENLPEMREREPGEEDDDPSLPF